MPIYNLCDNNKRKIQLTILMLLINIAPTTLNAQDNIVKQDSISAKTQKKTESQLDRKQFQEAEKLTLTIDANPAFTPLEQLGLQALTEACQSLDNSAIAKPNTSNGYKSLHVPFRNSFSRLLLKYQADLTGADSAWLELLLSKGKTGGDGVGLTILANVNDELISLGRIVIPGKEGSYALSTDLSTLTDQKLTIYFVLDPVRTTHADNIALEQAAISTADQVVLPFQRQEAYCLNEVELTSQEFSRFRPDPETIMRPHLQGRERGKNVYSALDSRRPMIGAHVYFSPEASARLPVLKDVFDYVTEDGKAIAQRRLELAGLPWVSINHNPIPVSAYDQSRFSRIDAIGDALAAGESRFVFRLGATLGSEPHFSPDYHYTGHKKEEIDELLTSPGGARDFGEWLAALYQDTTPQEDSNGDNITFAKDFSFSAASWAELGHAVPKDSPDYKYLQTLFKEHVIANVIASADRAFHKNPDLIITSRLLSPQYEATFGQSLRQLAIPTDAVGVTNYTSRSHALDPAATQMRFTPSKLFSSEKTYVDSFDIRPPFWKTSGACYGIFGPFPAVENFSFQLKTSFHDAELLMQFTLLELAPEAEPVTIFQQQLGANFLEKFSLALTPRDNCQYEIRVNSLTPARMNNRANVVLINPLFSDQAGNSIRLADYYFSSETGFILDSAPERRVDIGKNVSSYSPAITELRSGYIYQQGLRHGVRPVYNEFMPGNSVTNTPHNVWRSIYHELQYQPAGIIWFCYGGGAQGSSFSWMDCHYLATEIAVIRGQLEALGVYQQIQRPKRNLALFLPSAAPAPLSKMRDSEQAAGDALLAHSPDVLLADQFDKIAEYDNIVLLTGFMSGQADREWLTFLRQLAQEKAGQKKVMVLFGAPYLYTEPGCRGSGDFRRSLAEIMPLFPSELAVTVKNNAASQKIPFQISLKGIELTGAAWPAQINTDADLAKLTFNADTPIAYADDNLLVLTGIPKTGLDQLAARFFNLPLTPTRDSGWLRLLNSDSEIDRPGIYCLDATQSLRIPAEVKAWDLVRRQPVTELVIRGENVIFAPVLNELQLIDCGTARASVKYENPEQVEVEVFCPQYPFEGQVKPELLLYSPQPPQAKVDGQPVEVEAIDASNYWRITVRQNGLYLIGIGL